MLRQMQLAAAFLALALAGPVSGASGAAAGDVQPAPVSRERRYTLNARVRPLLFWIRKNDVGEARVTWREDRDGAHGYELLVGSDPLKAPRKINKWGYIAEHVSGADAAIVGVMKEANGDSVEDAEAQMARDGEGGFLFETIRANVQGGQFVSGTVQIRTPNDLTFRDLDSLLARAAAAAAPRRTVRVPDATAPGFLSAVADLLRETSAAQAGKPTDRPHLPAARAYIYNGRMYDLKMRSLKPRAEFIAEGRPRGPALDADFVITNRGTGNTTKFSIVYGTAGDLAGVPLKIVFRPKWWFEAELLLGE